MSNASAGAPQHKTGYTWDELEEMAGSSEYPFRKTAVETAQERVEEILDLFDTAERRDFKSATEALCERLDYDLAHRKALLAAIRLRNDFAHPRKASDSVGDESFCRASVAEYRYFVRSVAERLATLAEIQLARLHATPTGVGLSPEDALKAILAPVLNQDGRDAATVLARNGAMRDDLYSKIREWYPGAEAARVHDQVAEFLASDDDLRLLSSSRDVGELEANLLVIRRRNPLRDSRFETRTALNEMSTGLQGLTDRINAFRMRRNK